MAHKRPTITDVAQVAGVSKSTVSRVLNSRTQYMREETRQRVINAISDLEYRPSSVARSLVSKRTQTVGLVVAEYRNPFYTGIITAVESVAIKAGYNVILCNVGYDMDRGVAFLESLDERNIDGVMLMCGHSDELTSALAGQRVPVVSYEWSLDQATGMNGVVDVDYAPGIRDAVDHLVDSGHSRLAHVSGPANGATAILRREAFLDRIAERGIDPSNVPVAEGAFSIESGRQAFAKLMSIEDSPTAVFAANDLMALGVLWAANDYGLRVPDDLAVVGLDDIALAAEVRPALTTIALSQHRIGQVAMRMLLDLIALPHEPRKDPIFTETVSTQLIVRQSSASVA